MPTESTTKAELLLEAAKALMAEGETERGRLLLGSIIDVYPGKPAAREAQRLLAQSDGE